jgi:hypothetical protein
MKMASPFSSFMPDRTAVMGGSNENQGDPEDFSGLGIIHLDFHWFIFYW